MPNAEWVEVGFRGGAGREVEKGSGGVRWDKEGTAITITSFQPTNN